MGTVNEAKLQFRKSNYQLISCTKKIAEQAVTEEIVRKLTFNTRILSHITIFNRKRWSSLQEKW